MANVDENALIPVPQVVDQDVRTGVEAELTRIIKHSLFSETTRMKRFLKYVVAETLDGRGSRIKGYSLGIEVFDRPDDFDPQADTIVRVQAGQLRRRLDLYYSDSGQNSPIRIVIPKGTYEPIFEIRKLAEESKHIGSSPSALIAPIEKQNRPGIAVLTFDNLTGDESNSYLSEGLTIELVNALIQFRYLRIVSRTATAISSGLVKDLKKLGKTYNAQFVLSGSVRRVKNLIRVSVNLLSTETGEHVYSKIFDRQFTGDNLFEIQDEIATYIAANVGAPFGAVHRYNRRPNRGRRKSIDAYEAILKYYEINLSPTEAKARGLLKEIQALTDKNPRFSSAWAIQSLLETYLVTNSVMVQDAERRLKVALKDARKATVIDPENALAFMSLFIVQFHMGDIESYKKSAQKALMLNPYDYVMLAYHSVAAAHMGDWDAAFASQKAALSLIANPPIWFHAVTALKEIDKGNYQFLLDFLKEKNIPSTPSWVLFHWLCCAGHLGRDKLAKILIVEITSRDKGFAQHIYRACLRWNPTAKWLNYATEGCRKAGFEIEVATHP